MASASEFRISLILSKPKTETGFSGIALYQAKYGSKKFSIFRQFTSERLLISLSKRCFITFSLKSSISTVQAGFIVPSKGKGFPASQVAIGSSASASFGKSFPFSSRNILSV